MYFKLTMPNKITSKTTIPKKFGGFLLKQFCQCMNEFAKNR